MNDKYEYSTKVCANEVLDIPPGTWVNLHIQSDYFIVQANSLTYRIAIDKIIKVNIETVEKQTKEPKSPILRAIVGGILVCWLYPPFGILIGAVVGAISGIGHSNKTQTDQFLRISFVDKEYHGQTLTFSPISMLFDYKAGKLIEELSSRLSEGATTPPAENKVIEL